MSERWRVSYILDPGIQVASAIPGYPLLGVTFDHDGNGMLAKIEHQLELSDGLAPASVGESQKRLRLMLEALEFRYGLPLQMKEHRAEMLSSAPGRPAKTTGFVWATAGAAIAKPLAYPAESALTGAKDRLAVWLHLANSSSNGEEVADATALRNYFLIIEDMRFGKSLSAKEQRAKYARHFVSHAKLTKDGPLKFIKAEFGEAVAQFNPTDPRHVRMVRKWRAEARAIVDTELEKLLR